MKKNKNIIQLSDHFNVRRMLRFTLPSIIMMIFTSIYGVVDGFFVSNFAGKTPFAAVNFIMPFLMILGTVGFMFGTGGGALVARTLGEGKNEKANRLFSLFVKVTIVSGIAVAVVSFIFLPQIATLMKATGEMHKNAVIYGRIIIVALPFLMLQYLFQSFLIVAEKPKLGLYITLIAGCANMILDAVLIVKFGVAGAAAATAVSQVIGGAVPLIYFMRRNPTVLRLTKSKFDGKALAKAAANGSSELMSNISMSLVGILYNAQLMKVAGENGVAAYGVLMYVNMIFIAVFIGFTTGIAPVVSFHFGAENSKELKGLFKKSLGIISVCAVAMFLLAEVLARPLAQIFVGYDKELMEMTLRGFLIYSFSFLLSGFSIFGSGFFTALNDGLTSALISFLRTLVFQIAAVLVFPIFWGLDGIWFSVVAAEIMAVVITVVFLFIKRKKYNY